MADSDPDAVASSSVVRALSLLRELALHGEAMPLSRLAQAAGIPKSTTHRMLALLAAQGITYRSPEGHRLRPEWARLLQPGEYDREQRLRRRLTPHLVDLYTRSGLCADLVVWRGGEVHVVAAVFGHGDPAGGEHLLDHTAPHRSAAGKLFISLDQSGARRPGSRITWSKEERRQIRSSGVAVSSGGRLPGVVGVAVLVPTDGRDAPVALTLGGPSAQVNIPRTVLLLRQVAAASAADLRQSEHHR